MKGRIAFLIVSGHKPGPRNDCGEEMNIGGDSHYKNGRAGMRGQRQNLKKR